MPMLANTIIHDIAQDARMQAALDEMAAHPLSEVGTPTISMTFTAHLAAGAKTVRISIAMIDEGEMFAEDLGN